MKLMLEESGEVITWELFKKFYAECFPNNVRYVNEVQFLQLVQGNTLVVEYADRFKHMGCFYTLPMNKEWRYKKFKDGLRGNIKLVIVFLSIKEFLALI